MDERLDQIIREQAAQRRLLEALLAALAPEETPAERSLIEVLAELTGAVDDAAGTVSSLHSSVSRLAQERRVSEPA